PFHQEGRSMSDTTPPVDSPTVPADPLRAILDAVSAVQELEKRIATAWTDGTPLAAINKLRQRRHGREGYVHQLTALRLPAIAALSRMEKVSVGEAFRLVDGLGDSCGQLMGWDDKPWRDFREAEESGAFGAETIAAKRVHLKHDLLMCWSVFDAKVSQQCG